MYTLESSFSALEKNNEINIFAKFKSNNGFLKFGIKIICVVYENK